MTEGHPHKWATMLGLMVLSAILVGLATDNFYAGLATGMVLIFLDYAVNPDL